MTSTEKKLINSIATLAAAAVTYIVLNLREQKKIAKRMKRTAAFISDTEALNAKHADAGTLYSKEHSAELIDLMNLHRM